MPEGPEIRRAADRLADVLVGRPLESVWFAFDGLRPYQDELRSSRIGAVETRGKAMLIRFDCERSVYSHNQLYGRWFVRRRGRRPKTRRQLRLAIETETHAALLYSASEIAVLADHALLEHPFLARIGPDLLTQRPAAKAIADRLEEKRFRARSLGALLLDQSFVAGLGNYLRSEILHVRGLHPNHRGRDLTRKQRIGLARAIRTLTERSYETGGVTNDLRRAERLKRKGLPRRAWRHHVFGRAGDPCPTCGEVIVREDHGSRRIYRCPSCQPAPA